MRTPPASVVAFSALTLALLLLWLRRPGASVGTRWSWLFPFALAVGAGWVGALLDVRGLIGLGVFALVCHLAARSTPGAASAVVLHTLWLVLCAALFLHVLPGFDNPRVLDGVRLTADAVPYTKYLNFDKGAACLLMLALYAPALTGDDRGARHVAAGAWRVGVVVVLAMGVALAVGFVRWDPKLPEWWLLWLWSMLFLTALPEEALFRGVVQGGLDGWRVRARVAHPQRLEPPSPIVAWGSVIAAGVLFGVSHAAGGPVYVSLATLAGVGYGWVFSSTRSIAAAALAHTTLNAAHLLLFSYPALARALP